MAILCVGAAHWDIIGQAQGALHPGGDLPGQITRRPGGVALNVALGLAAHGCPVGLCAAVGADPEGAALIALAEQAGVDCTRIPKLEGSETDRYIAIEDRAGDLLAAIADIGLLERHADLIAQYAVAGIQSAVTLFLEANLPPATIQRIADRAAAAGMPIVANPVSPARASALGGLLSGPYRPIIIANLEEAGVLLQVQQHCAAVAAAALLDAGAGMAVVTNGARPVGLAAHGQTQMARPRQLAPGASVTGAGDALIAAFLAAPHWQSEPANALETALDAAAAHMTRGP